MSNLVGNINSTDDLWTLTVAVADSTRFVKVGTEICEVLATFPSMQYPDEAAGQLSPPRIRVKRGVGGTTPASHLSGAALTEYEDESAFAGAGGATPTLAAVLVEGNDADGAQITGLADPEDAQDAATMAYVDANAGVAVIANPNAVWEAEHLYLNGDRIAYDGFNVFQAVAGDALSGTVEPDFGSVEPGQQLDGDGDQSWVFIGIIDGFPFDNLIDSVAALTPVGVLTSVTVDLIAADIATLNSVPVEVVAAPGAGKVIVPVAASWYYAFGTVAFDNDGGKLALVLDARVMEADDTSLLDQEFEHVMFFALDRLNAASVDAINVALTVRVLTADPDGAGDGTARLTVLYYVMDLLP